MGVQGGARLVVQQAIPSHVGLGSGTQLALAVGAALFHLYDQDYSVAELARISGRGHQSGVGIGIFQSGGFVVDGGIPREFDRARPERIRTPLIFRHDFPPDWCFLVVTPASTAGYSGHREWQAFRPCRQYRQKMWTCLPPVSYAAPAGLIKIAKIVKLFNFSGNLITFILFSSFSFFFLLFLKNIVTYNYITISFSATVVSSFK